MSHPFYDRAPWQRLRRRMLIEADYRCSSCGEHMPQGLHLHHRKKLKDARALAYEPLNLVALCQPCHAREHAGPSGCDLDGTPRNPSHPWHGGGMKNRNSMPPRERGASQIALLVLKIG